jgi:hypothetical protein
LPDPLSTIEALRSTPAAAEIVRLAEQILRHRFPIFGQVIDTGIDIHWRKDYVHGMESGTQYFRSIPYLDFARVGDHKSIWELNRHQHLVILAQAFRFTEKPDYLAEIQSQLTSWLSANPYMRGINWASALEVAFRALSWVWIDHLAGPSFHDDFRRIWLTTLYRHGLYLERNLSIYFSPNTHLLGEAVALHTLGSLYPEFPRAQSWRKIGHQLIEQQMDRQVHSDGSHFEQSSYYHLYALDFFLWFALRAQTSTNFQEKLRRMAEYLDALMGSCGRLPLIGDDDGGRLFHPYGQRESFGRATLATCGIYFNQPGWIYKPSDLHEQAAWWLGRPALAASSQNQLPRKSSFFPDTGVAVMTGGAAQIIVKAGGFGPSSAGHSHSDALSFVCRNGFTDLLIDSGTYTYLADPAWRNQFRGSAAHNTVRIDGKDQAVPAGPFRWINPGSTRVTNWYSNEKGDSLATKCVYAGCLHQRQFLFRKPDLLLVVDTVSGPPGDHLVEQFWQIGSNPEITDYLYLSASAETVEGWRSTVFGTKEETRAKRVVYRGPLPIRLAAAVCFGSPATAFRLEGTLLKIEFTGNVAITEDFSQWITD